MPSTRARLKPGTVRLFVDAYLTQAERRRLKAIAAESLRTVSGLAQELECPLRREGPRVAGASSRDRRSPYAIRA